MPEGIRSHAFETSFIESPFMNDRLVTVASFENVFRAEYAKSLLHDEGIQAVVADGEFVSMAWYLSNAVGGIKVQVWEADAERAGHILERDLPDSEDDVPLDDDELARQAMEGQPEVYDEDDEYEPQPEEPTAEPELTSVVDRERLAWRAFLFAWFGLLLFPLSFYALYLLLQAVFGEGQLSPRGKGLLLGAFTLTVASLLLAWSWFEILA